jgi:hypothetical protein
MAMLTHRSGEQLEQTRAKAALNFTEAVTLHTEVSASDLVTVGSGMGLELFRTACSTNFAFIASELSITLASLNDGVMLWRLRQILNANFVLIAEA